MITRNWKYICYIFSHKFFVFRAGLITGAPLYRLLIHDWSKFRRMEWVAYREFFYGTRTPEVKLAFNKAWLSHIHWNKHHWDHHIIKDGDKWKPLPMPNKYIREMVADWAGAGRAINGEWELVEWYEKNKGSQLIHPETRVAVEYYIAAIKEAIREGKLK